MAPKKTTSKNTQATSSAPAEKQGSKTLQVVHKRLLGKFSESNWNPEHRMNWGAFLVKDYVKVVIPSKPERKMIMGMLKKSHIMKFLSAAPTGMSIIDVLEFYSNSKVCTKVVDNIEERYVQSEVQQQEIVVDCNTFCRILSCCRTQVHL